MGYAQLPYKGDTIHDLVSSRLERTMQETYPAAALKMISRTQHVIPFYGKDKVAVQSRSMCVYAFICTCGARYIGCTPRQLLKRIKEHHPAALQKGAVKCINSSILQHLVDYNHHVNPNEAFNIVHQILVHLSRRCATATSFYMWNQSPYSHLLNLNYASKNSSYKPYIYFGLRILPNILLCYTLNDFIILIVNPDSHL